MKSVVTVNSVTKTFGGLKALDRATMDVWEGKVTLLVGPNGSGKTTMINVITGLYKPDSGSVTYNGKDITGWPPHVIFDAGIVRTFQIPQPLLRLTVLENIMMAYRKNPGEAFLKAPFKRVWKREEEAALRRAMEILKLVRLDHMKDEEAYKLSGGQMKLLEVARALMSGANVILMDEPAAGVNPALAHELFQHLTRLKESLGITFLLVEHRLDLAMRYVDYCYAMFRGKIISHGKVKEVLDDKRVIESYLGA